MRLHAILCGQVQFDAAKRNSMQPSVIRCGQVQFDVANSNSLRPRVIHCNYE
ncbi:hypothetical protein RHMOL_Rhmol07G0105200 [Rhododendron molle]|uniref:Uncharacterized protein n=1 Tax=Rhododendron molle TaxID=49168 RepID=A0ACC0MZI9_RHOML|nr:hypothetical protein RHMOL_Rhmol07G0105200 [Rhododendron molle]